VCLLDEAQTLIHEVVQGVPHVDNGVKHHRNVSEHLQGCRDGGGVAPDQPGGQAEPSVHGHEVLLDDVDFRTPGRRFPAELAENLAALVEVEQRFFVLVLHQLDTDEEDACE